MKEFFSCWDARFADSPDADKNSASCLLTCCCTVTPRAVMEKLEEEEEESLQKEGSDSIPLQWLKPVGACGSVIDSRVERRIRASLH